MPEQPKQLSGPVKEPVIYTIPDQFYGLAAKAQLPSAVAAPAAVAAPTPPPAAGAPAKEKGSKAWILIPIIALLLLAGLGFGIWWFLKPKAAPAPSRPSVTLPSPQPKPQPQPEPEPEPQPEPEPATTTPATPTAIDPAADGDGDGLTQAEEELYGTDPRRPDTDGDGFSDSVEVVNLYNPAGFKPTKLIEAALVKTYEWDIDGQADGTVVSFLYPSTWVRSEGSQDSQVTVSEVGTDAVQGFVVNADAKDEGKTLLDHFLFRHPDVSPSEVQTFTTKSGLEGVRGPDMTEGLYRVYAAIDAGDRFLDIGYSLGAEPQPLARYRSTFTMFINSFAKKP